MMTSLVGTLLAQLDDPAGDAAPGLWTVLLSGGAVGVTILSLLFALSVAAAYLVFDQWMTLRVGEVMPEGVTETVRQALMSGRAAEADASCRRHPSVLSVVVLAGLAEREFGWREVEKAVEDGLAEQSARLMRRIEYLAVIGNIAPMIGLLGTVTGMVFAFQQVATTRGAAGAGDLAEGIYQALVTTVGGLIVAIPSLGAYAVCRNRVDALIADVAAQAQHALAPVKRRPGSRGRPPGPGPVSGLARTPLVPPAGVAPDSLKDTSSTSPAGESARPATGRDRPESTDGDRGDRPGPKS